jgi:hypothetical protein
LWEEVRVWVGVDPEMVESIPERETEELHLYSRSELVADEAWSVEMWWADQCRGVGGVRSVGK